MIQKEEKQWLLWRLEADPKGKLTKIPYQTNGYKASSVDASTWCDYETARQTLAKSSFFSGIGIVLTNGIVGIDLDHVIVNGVLIDEKSSRFVDECDTYTEISPSGTGLHILFSIDNDFVLASNKIKNGDSIAYEVYREGRYFTFTENIYLEKRIIRSITPEQLFEYLSILGFKQTKKEIQEELPTAIPTNIKSDEILDILFRARNGEKMRSIWNGDLSHNNNDHSAADFYLCQMLAFYSGCDYATIERLWLESPLGQREKTQKREDYRKVTIERAIRYTTKIYTADRSKDNVVDFVKKTVTKKVKGEDGKSREIEIDTIVLCTENIHIFLDTFEDFCGRFRFDTFKNKCEIKDPITNKWRELKDIDIIFIQTQISKLHPAFSLVSKQMTEDAVRYVCHKHSFDSVLEYFNSIHWDGEQRVDTWICRAYNVPETPYFIAVGANWLKGLVMRAIEPGTKFDYVMVLESKQGMKKSTSLHVLGDVFEKEGLPGWHVETVLTPDSKDFYMTFFGNLIVEFSEGETLSRSEVKKLKSVITVTHDDIRLPYERNVNRHYRRCVFAMTTNEDRYLKDETGNRRWLPVEVGSSINIDWIRENRDQLYAEAYYRAVVLKEPFWQFPDEETSAMQESRMVVDPQSELIEEWYATLGQERRMQGVTTRDAFNAITPASHMSFGEKITKVVEMQLASTLKNKLKLDRKTMYVNGVQKRLYFPTAETMPCTMDSKEALSVYQFDN